MRRAGVLPDRPLADRFVDYLQTQQIDAQVRDESQNGGNVEIWIVDEDRVATGREELARFESDPDAAVYADAAAKAKADRDAVIAEKLRAERQTSDRPQMVSRSTEPLHSRAPATALLMVLCLIVGFLTTLGESNPALIRALKITADPRGTTLPEIASGEIWRLVTPALLHFGLAHFLFNMSALYSLGVMVEERRGTGLFLMLCITLAIASGLAQFIITGPNFGGISGVITGLLGYILVKQWLQPRLKLWLPPNLILMFAIYMVLCTVAIPGVANAAHYGGLIIGALIALVGAIGEIGRGRTAAGDSAADQSPE